MKTYEHIEENIEEKLKSLSTFEKSEFERRFRFVLYSIFLKNNLVKQSNALQDTYQSSVIAKRRLEIQLSLLLVFLIAASYFYFGTSNELYFFYGLIIALGIGVDEVRSASMYTIYCIQKNNFQFEIKRYENEINQYGFFTRSEVDLTSEYDGEDEALIDKYRKKNIQARLELQLAILGYMNLEVELKNDN